MRWITMIGMLLALTAASAMAASTDTVTGFGLGTEWLDNSGSNWLHEDLFWQRRYEQHQEWHWSLASDRRFGLTDKSFTLGGYKAVNKSCGIGGEGEIAPSADVIAQHYLDVSGSCALADGYVANAGFRRSHYASDDADVLRLGGERYWGDERAAITLFQGRLRGAGATGTSVLVQWDHYYGDDSHIGLGLAGGNQVVRIAAGRVVVDGVTSLAVTGRHWFADRWGFDWRVTFDQQQSFFNRHGLYLALVYRY